MNKKHIVQIILFLNTILFCKLNYAKLFYTHDQEAYTLFQQGKFQEAAELFDAPKWKSASFIKSGQYDKAIDFLIKQKDVDSMYNLGNTFAYNGQFDEAIKSYEKVLAIKPDHKDAQYNLEVVKKIKKQEQNKNNSQDNNQNQKQNQSQKDKASSSNTDNNNSTQNDKTSTMNNQQSGNKNSKQQNQQDLLSQEKMHDNKSNESKYNDSKNNNFPPKTNSSKEKPKTSTQYDEKKQALEQWLNKIPDDPGGLLKQKFLRDYLRKKAQ